VSAVSRRVVLDTNAIVALLCPWHEHHQLVVRAATAALRESRGFGLVAHTLVEAYAVLTRLPAPYRLACSDAFELLHKNFGAAPLAALASSEYWTLIERAAAASVGGGRTYDALIAETAELLAPCDLLTFNAKHFAGADSPDLTIVDLMRAP
jgi:predicted nucleic acid-binding protein